jgi:hypothetical protein
MLLDQVYGLRERPRMSDGIADNQATNA